MHWRTRIKIISFVTSQESFSQVCPNLLVIVVTAHDIWNWISCCHQSSVGCVAVAMSWLWIKKLINLISFFVFNAVLFMLFLTFLRLVNIFPLWRSTRETQGIASQWINSLKAKRECFLPCQERSLLDVQRYQHRICWNYCCQLLFSFVIYLYIQGLDNEYETPGFRPQ